MRYLPPHIVIEGWPDRLDLVVALSKINYRKFLPEGLTPISDWWYTYLRHNVSTGGWELLPLSYTGNMRGVKRAVVSLGIPKEELTIADRPEITAPKKNMCYLEFYRITAGLSQQDVCDILWRDYQIPYNQSTLSKMERKYKNGLRYNQVRMPGAKILTALAAILNFSWSVTPSEILAQVSDIHNGQNPNNRPR